jgi:Zn-dependent protease
MIDTPAVLAAAIGVQLLAHEAGHAAVAAALRLPWRPVLTRHGPAIVVGRDDLALTRRQVVLTNAGGPLANLALCAVAYRLGLGLVVLEGLEIAALNLVLPRSDGARMLRPGRAIARARAEATS